ncbi:MAG: TIM barrel protein [Candidatus Rokubacteria bacterium]|nr:TIM barrel protein [Candidatus Rokubacteria bacterium]
MSPWPYLPTRSGRTCRSPAGLWRALERGEALGCGAVQIFLKSHRQWACRPLDADDVRAFTAARRTTGLRRVLAHDSSLVNLGAPAAGQWRQAVDASADELGRAEALALASVVIHPGSHLGEGVDAGVRRIAAALDEAIARTSGCRVKIALENIAGAGHPVGGHFGAPTPSA